MDNFLDTYADMNSGGSGYFHETGYACGSSDGHGSHHISGVGLGSSEGSGNADYGSDGELFSHITHGFDIEL